MKLYVLLAIVGRCPAPVLGDPEAIRAMLEAAVAAGPFTHMETVVVSFTPAGVTGCAVVGESHIAVHTWPEEGRLFLDVASCSTRESTRRALDAVVRALPEGRLELLEERSLDPDASAEERPGQG